MLLLRSQRWLGALCGVILLAATCAPAVVRMKCLVAGSVTVSLGQMDGCCADEHEADRPSFSAVCCDVDGTWPVKPDLASTPTCSIPGATFLLAEPQPSMAASCPAPLAGYRLRSRPPPLLVSERLSQERVFRV